MEITEVRIKLLPRRIGRNERMVALASVTFDHDFVIPDLKVIRGDSRILVTMPDRQRTDRCGRCCKKNPIRAAFCNSCGGRLDPNRALVDGEWVRLHVDLVHPTNTETRERIRDAVVEAYIDEVELAKRPGYRCTYKGPEDHDIEEPVVGGIDAPALRSA